MKKYAGYLPRSIAGIIDLIILYSISTIIGVFFERQQLIPNAFLQTDRLTNIQIGLGNLITDTVRLLPGLLFCYLISTKKYTPGKYLMGIRIIKETGRNLTFWEAFLREFCKAISLLVLGLGLIWILIDKKRQGWHDKLIKSVVVEK